MTVSVLNRTFKGLAELKLRRTSDGAILHLPTPNTFIVENNVEEKIQYTRTAQGERSRAGSYVSGREPMLRISYSHMQPETMQFKIGNEFETKTSTLKVARSFTVIQNNYPAVTTTGTLGFNVLEDAPAQASITRDNVSFQLTQTPWDTFDPTVQNSFAIGAAFAVKFSNNIVTSQQTVSLLVDEQFTGLGIGDNIVGAHSVIATIITTENKLVIFRANYITPSIAGSGFDASSEQMEIPFFINTQSGECFPYELFFTNVTVNC